MGYVDLGAARGVADSGRDLPAFAEASARPRGDAATGEGVVGELRGYEGRQIDGLCRLPGFRCRLGLCFGFGWRRCLLGLRGDGEPMGVY